MASPCWSSAMQSPEREQLTDVSGSPASRIGFHAEGPPAGLVDTSKFPAPSATTHRRSDPQATSTTPSANGIRRHTVWLLPGFPHAGTVVEYSSRLRQRRGDGQM